jgi:GT2 family glycosyltransferase
LDSPSGASLYATREAIERIGVMDERYFLYFEDLEWGCRAKREGRVGYAHRSIVVHKGGTTIGSAARRKDRSALSVYLSSRNAILFVKDYYPAWLPWTVVMQCVHIGAFALAGSFRNVTASFRGLAAGLASEIGKPKG